MKIKLSCLIFSVFFCGCDYSYQKEIGESYFLRAINSPVTMSIGFGNSKINEGLIDQTIFEVHWNDDFILAKRHPSKGINLADIDRNQVDCYVIKKVNFRDKKASEYVEGPLRKEDYSKRILELGLDEDDMSSLTFNDLK
ncbi:hypothetical protein MM239_01510 [Belliella sp. DSM 111904]|uniref:DUF3997 domain-containing protein n=1 Tax=Belliella filtrata TaxID=2923435 RepID=A0ABS9UV66_9BACT|nr:hypothetical protein [Belliella filtrata]MCH7408057.1 hypothetical protein [Belliella filtrata]